MRKLFRIWRRDPAASFVAIALILVLALIAGAFATHWRTATCVERCTGHGAHPLECRAACESNL